MIKDIFLSFKDSISQKTRNPFLGTYVIVWTVRNWELVFALLNFDADQKLKQKVEFIELYYQNSNFISDLLSNILWTFGVLLLTYSLINLSRLIVNFFDKVVSPQVYKITDKSSIVLKSDYQNLERKIEELEQKVQGERDSRLKVQGENENLEKRISELISQTTEPTLNENPPKEKPAEPKARSTKKKSTKAELIFNKYKKENKLPEFESIASDILNGESLQKGRKIVRESSKNGLIEPGNYSTPPDWYNYKLTALGKEIHDILLMEQLKSG